VLNQKQALKCSVLQGMPLDEDSDNYSGNKGGKTPLLLSHSTGISQGSVELQKWSPTQEFRICLEFDKPSFV